MDLSDSNDAALPLDSKNASGRSLLTNTGGPVCRCARSFIDAVGIVADGAAVAAVAWVTSFRNMDGELAVYAVGAAGPLMTASLLTVLWSHCDLKIGFLGGCSMNG